MLCMCVYGVYEGRLNDRSEERRKKEEDNDERMIMRDRLNGIIACR